MLFRSLIYASCKDISRNIIVRDERERGDVDSIEERFEEEAFLFEFDSD